MYETLYSIETLYPSRVKNNKKEPVTEAYRVWSLPFSSPRQIASFFNSDSCHQEEMALETQEFHWLDSCMNYKILNSSTLVSFL